MGHAPTAVSTLPQGTEAPASRSPSRPLIVAVIPTYRAAKTIRRVVDRALSVVDAVVVVDDCCPEHSSALLEANPRIQIIIHDRNRGVGGAMKTGIKQALAQGADYIVKIDADDQMDTRFVPQMIDILEQCAEVDLIKGNRFADPATLRTMPVARLLGNAGLTLMIKFSSGYWTIVDPTNGFIALRAETIRDIDLSVLADRYFFEADLLCMFGLRRRVIAELEMPAIYHGESSSSLSIPRVLFSFPPKLFARFLRRLLINYLVVEVNVGSLCGLIGLPLLVFAMIFGAEEWAVSVSSGITRPTGTIILALLLFMIGFQLSLQALLYDVQFSTRTLKFRGSHDRGVREESPLAAELDQPPT
jgi:glycosyltransferase involved in cell wall biosynthesis